MAVCNSLSPTIRLCSSLLRECIAMITVHFACRSLCIRAIWHLLTAVPARSTNYQVIK